MFLINNPKKFTGNLVSGDGESAGRSLSYDEAIAEARSWLERRS
jgi:hypothetical protein